MAMVGWFLPPISEWLTKKRPVMGRTLPWSSISVMFCGILSLHWHEICEGEFARGLAVLTLGIVLGTSAIAGLGIIVTGCAAALLRLFEFFIRRIAEYPNGPILGASVLSGCIVALLKALA